MKYSCLRYKKQEKFAPYIPIAKARGFTALSGKKFRKVDKYKFYRQFWDRDIV
jgi:hypothetical protein